MSTLIAVVFHDESTAFEMRGALAKMQGPIPPRDGRRRGGNAGPERQNQIAPSCKPDSCAPRLS